MVGGCGGLGVEGNGGRGRGGVGVWGGVWGGEGRGDAWGGGISGEGWDHLGCGYEIWHRSVRRAVSCDEPALSLMDSRCLE